MKTTVNAPIALILGITGSLGAEMARKLHARGWKVRALHRDPARVQHVNRDVEWHKGDAMERADVVAAAQGATLIVHGVNPPGYRNWSGLVLPMIDNTIAAARSSGARIVLPGTVYNFGASAFPILREDSPQEPHTKKGAIRVELERRLRAASENGVRVLIVRAGDFFGPGMTANSWFNAGLLKPNRPVTGVQYPGAKGIGHQWAYLPDVAETMVRLLELGERLPAFALYHMDGHWDEDGSKMVEAIGRASGKPHLKASRLPWWALRLAAPFNETLRELMEMRYLWQRPIRMDNARLVQVLGAEPHTPLDSAVKTTLASMGCL
ncbi:MAG TPA: NAD-dependent epimerase/dehydratase family protein [Burkholderiaceae bacterium]